MQRKFEMLNELRNYHDIQVFIEWDWEDIEYDFDSSENQLRY